jgi:hypothetical protein
LKAGGLCSKQSFAKMLGSGCVGAGAVPSGTSSSVVLVMLCFWHKLSQGSSNSFCSCCGDLCVVLSCWNGSLKLECMQCIRCWLF